jgi:hypothetical protein
MAMAIWGDERVCVAVLYPNPPTDAEWQRWIALLRERSGSQARVLVETYAGPNAAQRKTLAAATSGQDVRFAIMTDSIVVRGIVTALAWLGVPHRAFALGQLPAAANFLELDPQELDRIHDELRRLRTEAGLSRSMQPLGEPR